ncbi:MAG: type II secretion system protein [bacterium]
MKFLSQQFKKITARSAGFTLLELLISISIFAFMTAFLVAKYGTFNQGILLTNLAYDTALTIRSAQSYGLNVQGQASTTAGLAFNYAYGVHFDIDNPTQFIMFVDLCQDLRYRKFGPPMLLCRNGTTHVNEIISTYTFRKGFSIEHLCLGSMLDCKPLNTGEGLDVTFKRPSPDAIIQNTATDIDPAVRHTYAEIGLKATDGSVKRIIIQSTGQVDIAN